jgi:hypothetical protein
VTALRHAVVAGALVASARAAAAPGTCAFPPVVVARAPAIAAPACHRPPVDVAAELRAQVAHDFKPEHTGGRGEIAFSCDGLGAQLDDIVVEAGSGHGGTLLLWHAHRRADGRWDTRGIVYQGLSMMGPAPVPPYQLASAVVDLTDRQLEVARAALTGKVHEVAPPPPPDTLGLSGFGTSSNDLHTRIRLTDHDGRAVDRRFTGYLGSDQPRYLGLGYAHIALEPMWSAPIAQTAPSADDRALFTERFLAEQPLFDEEYSWWVMEREVDLAKYLGTPATLPGLLSRLKFAKLDRSHDDARKDALAAIAAITGWEARKPGESDGEVARDYLAACHAAKPTP